MLKTFYKKFCHLRIAQPIISDINSIDKVLYDFHSKTAINLISRLTLKYENDLNKIAFYLSGRPVVKGEMNILYKEHTIENLEDDLYYLKDCLIVIGSVRFGVVKSIEDALMLIIPEEFEEDKNPDFTENLAYIE